MNLKNVLFRLLLGPLLVAGLLLGQPAAAQSSSSTRNILQEITNVVGLKPRFDLRATTDVPNAAAVVSGGKRYLLYNPNFVAAVNRAGHTDWAGISILAHEMGHHLNGHTLRAGGSNPADELEADEFSGFVLRKMGASLAQAQTAMAVVAQDEDSPTHPGRTTRLSAIGRGWQQANTQIVASSRGTGPSSAPVAVATRPPQPQPRVQAQPRPQPVSRPVAVVPVAAKPVSVVGRLIFNDSDEPYYLTNRLSVVRVDPDDQSAEIVGRLTRSESDEFPFVLVDSQQRRLFVSQHGFIYNARGEQVGRMAEGS